MPLIRPEDYHKGRRANRRTPGDRGRPASDGAKYQLPVAGVAGVPPITGTGASEFVFSSAASGIETFSGVGASAYMWNDAASGGETFSGVAASTFAWTDAAVSTLGFAATGGSIFTWSDAGVGDTLLAVTGTGASAFGYSPGATGLLTFTGAGHVAPYDPEIYDPALFDTVSGSSFGWSVSANDIPIVVISGSGAPLWGPPRWAPTKRIEPRQWPVYQPEPITGEGASTFDFRTRARGRAIPSVGGQAESVFVFFDRARGRYTPLAIHGDGQVAFAWRSSGVGEIDDSPILEEFSVLGLTEEDLVGV
jgi:hypothetical protein